VVTINKVAAKGQTPYSLKFGETYNDPTGPWLKVARDATFGTNVDQALQQGQNTLSAALSSQ
jgi:multiple sugar transport system substrate-binding protein